MKRKSIYTILWQVAFLYLVWQFISTAGTGTVITAYIVFRTACFLLRLCLSAFYVLGVVLLFLLLLFLFIL